MMKLNYLRKKSQHFHYGYESVISLDKDAVDAYNILLLVV